MMAGTFSGRRLSLSLGVSLNLLSTMSVRGFILQPTYRIEEGHPIVHLYGVLETGGPFLIRDDRQVPHFYIESEDESRAHDLGARRMESSDRRTMEGRPVVRVNVPRPSDTPRLRGRLKKNGVHCYEADVRFAMRYLIDRGVRGSLTIEGTPKQQAGLGKVFENPEIGPSDWVPRLSVLSIDIETDPEARRLLSIALHGCGASEVLVLNPDGDPLPEFACGYAHEMELLSALNHRVSALDPDILTGWNVVDFDLHVLEKIARKRETPLTLGRGSGLLRLRPSRWPWSTLEATVPGRVVLDGIQLLRSSFMKMEEYSLDYVSRHLLGEGKIIHGSGRAEEILEAFHNDKDRFLEYNLTDARLVTEILDKVKLIDLAVTRSLLTGLPVDRVSGSIAAFDFLYMSQMHKRGLVAPSVGSSDTATSNPGGYVLNPESGLHENVLVFDFKSLYPSLIRTFQIDPLGYLPGSTSDDGQDVIEAPNGARFRREPGVLPRLLDELFPKREEAKAADDKIASYAIKILMNSFYGVLGTPACRFSRPELAGAITTFGKEILLWSKARIESLGLRVLYGDTDSLFVLSGKRTPAEARALGAEIVIRLNRDIAVHIRETWDVESRLELEFERLYLKLHLPEMRHGRGGARKRYVGLVEEGDHTKVVFTGTEVVRRDWTDLAKQVQRELYDRLFEERELAGYVRDIVAEVRAGRLDSLLVYRKALRKSLDGYTATTPPHVAAARKMSQPPGRLVSYLITKAGPEPLEEIQSPIDHEHYVQKQVRPVAEPLLGLLDLKFDRVVGDDTQLSLF